MLIKSLSFVLCAALINLPGTLHPFSAQPLTVETQKTAPATQTQEPTVFLWERKKPTLMQRIDKFGEEFKKRSLHYKISFGLVMGASIMATMYGIIAGYDYVADYFSPIARIERRFTHQENRLKSRIEHLRSQLNNLEKIQTALSLRKQNILLKKQTLAEKLLEELLKLHTHFLKMYTHHLRTNEEFDLSEILTSLTELEDKINRFLE